MIRSLLAHTTIEQDAIGAAEKSWNALLKVVSEGMPRARSFRIGDLPEALRQRHSLIGGSEQRALRALSEHSVLILDGIRTKIGRSLHLPRENLVQQVIEQLESTQVVMISGTAGNGKSVIAKDAFSILVTDHFGFSFRAEEFARPHLDEVLQSNQIPANASLLGAILSGQDRKVLLVESVERLLEKSVRDAFTDLLTLMARDQSWRLLLTCRDYSTDLVISCFLESISVSYSIVTIPLLDDAELKEVEIAYPKLIRPLANTALRQLLRNPYILDKALQISWSEALPLPKSEREFRALFWREIVRVDKHAASGMPRRRENTFGEIALRRAQELSQYAACGDLDPEVVDSLRHDSLIVSSQMSSAFLAPAHDVLEDWAILWWINESYLIHNNSLGDLSRLLGTYPAIRRTYRKWVSELVEWNPDTADQLFKAVLHEDALSAQFRDDTLVSLLRSTASVAFLERHVTELFTNDKQLLRRVIHLLRVACVTTPAWMRTTADLPLLIRVPDGMAWPCILRMIQTQLQSFAREDHSLLLGLIEDWARGVSWQSPYPEGNESVAIIAYWLLPEFDDYRSKDQHKHTLQVIAKIPNADPERFASILKGTTNEKRNRVVEDFQELIFEDLEGTPAARDIPELFISIAKDYILCTEADLNRKRGYMRDLNLEPLFGIKLERGRGFFPASAYQGPYLPLMRYHPQKGLDFMITVFNHSIDWYAHPRVTSRYVEPPYEIMLTYSDGTTRKQWCNARLWNLYRGTSVGPYLLQSLLMALERWLLEFAKEYPSDIDAILLYILQRSNSAALTAVVASIATAVPQAAGETLLVLLRSPMCIRLDRQRFAKESQALSSLSGIFNQVHVRNKIFSEERKEADALPHRRNDLETAIAKLQFGNLSEQVHEILDKHRASMPSIDEQNDEDRLWRLALHRMDMRQYTIAEDTAEASDIFDDRSSEESGQRFIRLNLNEPESDIQEMINKANTQLQPINTGLELLMWGVKVFGHEEVAIYDPNHWRQKLQEAEALSSEFGRDIENGLGRNGPGYVAAVCVRDHWEEMTIDEQDWTVDIICSEVEREGDHWGQLASVQRNSMSADRPCAWVLPFLIAKTRNDLQTSRIRNVLMIALTHAIDEVRWYAALGIGRYLWKIDRKLVLQCVYAVALEAMLLQKAEDEERYHPYMENDEAAKIQEEASLFVRTKVFEAGGITSDIYEGMNTNTLIGAEANTRILAIMSQAATDAVSIAAFERLARTIVEWWNLDDDGRQNHMQVRPERNYETELSLAELLEHFLLQTSSEDSINIIQPIVDAIDHHPDEVHWILTGLISVEDRQPNTSLFWRVWKEFADGVRQAKWLESIDHEHAYGRKMIYAIFLVTWWKEDIHHWRSLEGYAWQVHAFFNDLPASSTVLDAYLRFLDHIGEQSLPDSFINIANSLKKGDSMQMLRKGNTVFLLELLLQRYVYGRPMELKMRTELKESVLFLLDSLVEKGSSAAFRMRDDFVTPLPIHRVN